MLKRVTLGLESGGRRLFRGRLKNRMLHSSFWVHGAGEFDPSFMAASLFAWCHHSGPSAITANANGGGTEAGNCRDDDGDANKLRRILPTVREFVQLDFLYPFKTLAFLRTLSSPRIDAHELLPPRTVFLRSCKRFYSSGTGPDDPTSEIPGDDEDLNIEADFSTIGPPKYPNFNEFYSAQEYGRSDELWYHYNNEKYNGDQVEQQNRRIWTMQYFKNSRRMVDWWRIIHMVKELHWRERTTRDYQKLVQAYLRFRWTDKAVDALLENIVNSQSCKEAGFEEVMGYYINEDQWDNALELWRLLKERRPDQVDGLKWHWIPNRITDYVQRIMYWVQHLPEGSPHTEFGEGLLRGAFEATINRKNSLEEVMQFEDLWKAMEARGMKIREQDMKNAIYELCHHRAYERVTEIYKIYRELPPEKPPLGVLNAALRSYRALLDFHGLQMVLDDFFRFGTQPDMQAYYLLMTEMARHGEAQAVEELLEQFIERFQPSDSRPFTHILQAYTKRGELEEVIRWFDRLTEYGVAPNLECYNILINAYGKTHDVNNALQRVQEMINAQLTPDIYTFATLMTIAAERGDVENTKRLMEMAKEYDIEPNYVMYLALISACVEAGEMDNAEEVLRLVEESGTNEPKTELWNKVLSGYATQSDSEKLTLTYNRMQKLGVPFDSYTYGILMHSLTLIGRIDAAESTLDIMEQEEGMKATSTHYAIIMVGYMRKLDLNRVWETFNKMLEKDIAPSFMTQAVLLQASAFVEHADYRRHRAGTLFLESAEQILTELTQRLDVLDLSSTDNVKSATPPWLFTPLISIYGKEGSVERAVEHYERFLEISELQKPGGTTPSLKMYFAIMNAYMHSNNIEGVRQIWQLIKNLSRKLSLPTDKSLPNTKILWSRRHELCTPISVYIHAMTRIGDLESVDFEIQALINEGYELDNNCWNNYVQTFAIAGSMLPAFMVCEEKLMPGWTARKSFYSQRRFDRRPFPMFYPFIRTLETLVTELDALEKKWKEGDGKVLAMFDELRVACPLTWEACQNLEGSVDRIEKEKSYRRHWS